jgi:hypothetical protein
MKNLEGLPPAYLLAALYNNSRPQGFSFNYYRPGNMTIREAEEILYDYFPIGREKAVFDYIHGRPIKVSFHRNSEGETFVGRTDLYDRDLGAGAFDRAAFQALDLYTKG